MPHGMRIQHEPPRHKLAQLRAHGHAHARDDARRPQRPRLARAPEPPRRPRDPHDVLRDPDRDVGAHVVGVVPADEREEGDVRGEGGRAGEGPEPQRGLPVVAVGVLLLLLRRG